MVLGCNRASSRFAFSGVPTWPCLWSKARSLSGAEAGGEVGGQLAKVQLTPSGSTGFNPAFDVTPARLVTALITERGVAAASEAGLRGLYGQL